MKIKSIILAGIFGTALASQGEVVYQSDFTGDAPTLADVGLVKSAGAASGSWIIDAANDQLDGVGINNARSNVSTINSWQSDGGFTLDVTFRWTDTTPVRFDFGLVDAAYTISASNAWLSAALAGAYGVGFSSTIGATDGLFFNNGSSVSSISTAQGDITDATQTFSMTITATTWSYSLNGAPATTGTHTFDTSRSYRFTAHAQSNDQATFDNITVTAHTPDFPTWIAGTFTNGTVTNQGPNDDDDNDGISNLVEYAIDGQDPTVPNASVGTFSGNVLSFTKRGDATGLTYAIEESTGLVGWAEVSGGSYVNNATTISYPLTPGSPEKNFVRLKVTQN